MESADSNSSVDDIIHLFELQYVLDNGKPNPPAPPVYLSNMKHFLTLILQPWRRSCWLGDR